MLVSLLAPKEGTSLLGLDGVPTSGWINPLLSIKLEDKKGGVNPKLLKELAPGVAS